jgi:cytochrome-b5 reductase
LNYLSRKLEDVFKGIKYRQFELIQKTQITHDTYIYTFKLPMYVWMQPPNGYHVFLRLNNLIIKPYTVIRESMDDTNESTLSLMIKHYENGQLTSNLCNIELHSLVEISNFAGSFDNELLFKSTELICIAAGTGITPMINILYDTLKMNQINKILLLFFNKTTNDIIWNERFQNFEKEYSKYDS